MPYGTVEVSEFSAKQTYLYRIVGVSWEYNYTDAQKTITATINGSSYDFTHPKGGISHTEAAMSQDPGRSSTTLTVSIGNPIVRKHNQYPPHGNTTLVIYRQNEIGGDPYQIWSGTLFAPMIDGVECDFECLTDYELMKRAEGLNDTFQSLCNWFLGQHPCPVNLANWRVACSVVSVDTENFTVTVSGASAFTADYFTAGHLTAPNGDMRTVIDDVVSGSNHILTLQQNFPSTTLLVAGSVDAYPGCDRAATTCGSKFGSETGSGAAFGGNPIQTNTNPHEIGRLQ